MITVLFSCAVIGQRNFKSGFAACRCINKNNNNNTRKKNQRTLSEAIEDSHLCNGCAKNVGYSLVVFIITL